MKKIFLKIVTIAMVLVVILFVTNVKAATLTVDQNKMDKEEVLTITVKTKEVVSSMEFKLTFDNTKYEYVDKSVSTALNVSDAKVNGNVLTVSAFDLGDTVTDTITVQFKSKDYGEGIPFSISGTEFIKGDDSKLEDTFENETIKVTVEKKEVKPSEPEQPEQPNKPEEPTKPVKPSEPEKKPSDIKKPTTGYIDDNGKEIKKLPQTGSIIPAVITLMVVFAFTGIAIYKKNKNK